ncbi:hypothetical protein AB0F03_24510 [Streptomyces sp. NPDC028722]|uniref:hypothetical protein n=1 Tax=Streptomyces sp. NPDC028722 TaxID=3155016 RepID=UPI003410EF2D
MAVLLLAGCAGSKQDGDQSVPRPSPSSESRTAPPSDAASALPIDADQVLCSDWNTSLSDTRRSQVATDLLVARRREDGIDAEPKQALLERMTTEVTDACEQLPTTLVRAIARFRYAASKDLYGFQ